MLEVTEVVAADARFAALLDAFVAELSERYCLDATWSGWAPLADGARYLLGSDGDRPVGCVALIPFAHSVPGAPSDEGEVKRLFVLPQDRGRGASKLLLAAVVDLARSSGYRRLWLETGDRQPEAIGLYRRTGWQPTERYGPWVDSPESLCFVLELSAAR